MRYFTGIFFDVSNSSTPRTPTTPAPKNSSPDQDAVIKALRAQLDIATEENAKLSLAASRAETTGREQAEEREQYIAELEKIINEQDNTIRDLNNLNAANMITFKSWENGYYAYKDKYIKSREEIAELKRSIQELSDEMDGVLGIHGSPRSPLSHFFRIPRTQETSTQTESLQLQK